MTILQTAEKWLRRAELVLIYLGVLATLGVMCLTSADALSRYAFNRPIIGAYEFTEKYLMVASIFLGLSYAYRGGIFIRVTFLVDRFPSALKGWVNQAVHLITLAFCLFVLVATTGQAIRGWQDDTTLSALPIPVGPAYSLVPLGFLALTLVLLADLPRVRSGKSYLFKEESSTI
jgi:TRAP-type C4-dicarboxylate transport system permease small subunit